jgi:hypothetical protein
MLSGSPGLLPPRRLSKVAGAEVPLLERSGLCSALVASERVLAAVPRVSFPDAAAVLGLLCGLVFALGLRLDPPTLVTPSSLLLMLTASPRACSATDVGSASLVLHSALTLSPAPLLSSAVTLVAGGTASSPSKRSLFIWFSIPVSWKECLELYRRYKHSGHQRCGVKKNCGYRDLPQEVVRCFGIHVQRAVGLLRLDTVYSGHGSSATERDKTRPECGCSPFSICRDSFMTRCTSTCTPFRRTPRLRRYANNEYRCRSCGR